MDQKTIVYIVTVLLLAFLLGTCGPSPVIDSELGTSTDVPIVEPTNIFPPAIAQEPTEVIETQLPPTQTPDPTCKGIFQHDLFMYPIPSDSVTGERFTSGAHVDVIGQLNEPVWYQVTFINFTGWVLQSRVRLDDPDCKVPQLGLAEAIGLSGVPIIEDTFRDSQNWILLNTPDERPDRTPNSVNNYTLQADGYFERVALSAPAIENVPPFELATAYWRQNGGDLSSFVGIQYGSPSRYFEIRVLGNCEIEIMTSDGFYEKQTTRNERNNCKDDISDFLFVRWDGNSTLEVGLNDNEQPFRFNIGASFPATGKIQLIADQARTQFDFLVVTGN